jgi:hypothetical protein
MTTAFEILDAIKKASPEVQYEVISALKLNTTTPTSIYDKIEREMQALCREANLTVSEQEVNKIYNDLQNA